MAEAKREGWLGEVDGLEVHLAGAEQKLSQLDQIVSRKTITDLGIPPFAEVAGRATAWLDQRRRMRPATCPLAPV
jgi:hypothetical protein